MSSKQSALLSELAQAIEDYASAKSRRDWQDDQGWNDPSIAEAARVHDAAKLKLQSLLLSITVRKKRPAAISDQQKQITELQARADKLEKT